MLQSLETIHTDVLVIGLGISGAAAAIAARDAGADVLVVEKMPAGGGTGALLQESVCVPESEAFAGYLETLSHGIAEKDVIETFCRDAMAIPAWLEALGGRVTCTGTGGLYQDVPNSSEMKLISAGLPGQEDTAASGAALYQLLLQAVSAKAIPVLYETRAVRLITDSDGRVTGAVVSCGEGEKEIDAGKGVILACGGFAGNADLMREFILERPVCNLGSPGSTGDGLILGTGAGAALRHLSVLNASVLSYQPEDCPAAAPIFFKGGRVCFVNQDGQQILASDAAAEQHQTYHAELRHFDFRKMRFHNNPCYAVFDENVLESGPLSTGGYFAQLYTWSAGSTEEVEKGWIKRADDAEMLAQQLGIDPDMLSETLADFFDTDGPFYAMTLTLGTYHTTGGLGRDAKARALDWCDRPVRGLYAAGECGSALGLVYQPGTYLAEAITSGLAAGRTAVEDAGV